jgi:hypothetical protein
MNRFWIVWSPQGDRPPTHRHRSRQEAKREAERLAGKTSNHEFFVLEAQSVSQYKTVHTVELSAAGCWDDELPF